MARIGHDIERAAMIYQHQVRGADEAITKATDTNVQAEQDSEPLRTARPGVVQAVQLR